MKQKRFTIKTKTEAEDMVICTLDEIGIEGVEILDKQPLTEDDKAQMFVDIMLDGPEDDGVAYLNFYLEEDADTEEVLKNVRAALDELETFMDIGEATIEESETEDKDWINNWKEFFHQFYVDDILIVPSWEEVKEEDKNKMILHIDPAAEDYEKTAEEHWNTCSYTGCKFVFNQEAHKFGDLQEAEDGSKYKECEVCKFVITETAEEAKI